MISWSVIKNYTIKNTLVMSRGPLDNHGNSLERGED